MRHVCPIIRRLQFIRITYIGKPYEPGSRNPGEGPTDAAGSRVDLGV